MERHLKTGTVCFQIADEVKVLDYLDWLKYHDWSIKAQRTINEILSS